MNHSGRTLVEILSYETPFLSEPHGRVRPPELTTMGNIRTKYSKKRKWYLGKHELLSTIHFALQYWDWKEEYAMLIAKGAGSPELSDDIKAHNVSSPTENDGIRAVELSQKIQKVDDAIEEAAGPFSKWLLKGVTQEHITYSWLEQFMDIPCGRKMYYSMRRKFYWLLHKKI